MTESFECYIYIYIYIYKTRYIYINQKYLKTIKNSHSIILNDLMQACAPQNYFANTQVRKKTLNGTDVKFDFSIGCIPVNFPILWIESYFMNIYNHWPLPVPQILQTYISQMAKHCKFLLYLTITTTETCISTNHLTKMQK